MLISIIIKTENIFDGTILKTLKQTEAEQLKNEFFDYLNLTPEKDLFDLQDADTVCVPLQIGFNKTKQLQDTLSYMSVKNKTKQNIIYTFDGDMDMSNIINSNCIARLKNHTDPSILPTNSHKNPL